MFQDIHRKLERTIPQILPSTYMSDHWSNIYYIHKCDVHISRSRLDFVGPINYSSNSYCNRNTNPSQGIIVGKHHVYCIVYVYVYSVQHVCVCICILMQNKQRGCTKQTHVEGARLWTLKREHLELCVRCVAKLICFENEKQDDAHPESIPFNISVFVCAYQ